MVCEQEQAHDQRRHQGKTAADTQSPLFVRASTAGAAKVGPQLSREARASAQLEGRMAELV